MPHCRCIHAELHPTATCSNAASSPLAIGLIAAFHIDCSKQKDCMRHGIGIASATKHQACSSIHPLRQQQISMVAAFRQVYCSVFWCAVRARMGSGAGCMQKP